MDVSRLFRLSGGVLAACLVFAPARAVDAPRGQASELVEAWSTDKGLPETTVTAVIQTRDGYIWAGTDGGLARFDGMRFTTFRAGSAGGLANHAITELFEDRAGTLWIGTESGLVRYRNRAFDTIGLEGRAILALCEDADGALWIGTDAGLHRWRGDSIERVQDPALPAGAVRALAADAVGRIWIGVAQVPGVVRHAGGKMELLPTGGEVQAIAVQRGVVWLATRAGLLRTRDGGFVSFGMAEGLASSQVSDLHADRDGGLWVASTALQRISGADMTAISTVRPVVARTFNALWHDRESNLWVGTAGDGLMCVRTAPFRLLTLNARTQADGFRTVMQGPGGPMWLAQGTLGYTRVAGEANVRRTLPGEMPGVGEVLAVYAAQAGDLWVGGRLALQRTRGATTEVRTEFAGMRTLFEDRRGTMWMGRQNGGIVCWRDGQYAVFKLPESVARCTPASFAEARNGDIWVGTWNHGVLRIRGEDVAVFNKENGAPTDEMRYAYIDRDDRLWVGTRNRGLALLEGEQWLLPDWTAELFDGQIASLIEDGAGNLWLVTARGVLKVERSSLMLAMRGALPINRLRVINATEGLRQQLSDLACFPAAWRSREGQLWFALRQGVLNLDPAGGAPGLPPPAVHIERVLVNGERQALADEIVLPPDTQGLAIEYTGLSFTAPGHLRFRYRLDGVENRWVAAEDRRMANYTKLRPGTYRFQVAASNAAGVWSDPPASFTIVQRGYFYQQRWVRWAAGLVLAGGVVGAYRWRVAVHARERRRLEVGIAERTRELRSAKEHAEASTRAKADFLEGISHEIRNPLNGIIGLVAMLREAPLDARERELAQSLGACAKGLARVFDEVLNFARLEHGGLAVHAQPFGLGALVDEVAAMFRMMARQRGSEIVVRREGDVPERWIGDGEKIKSILGNFVSNALKYAPGSPVEILVQCDARDEFGADVTFNVTDRGPGIPAEEQERIFEKFVRGSAARAQRTPGTGLGLAACRALAEMMGGHVAVESPVTAPAAGAPGATFFLRVRLKPDRNPAPLPADDFAAEKAPVPVGRALIVEDQPYNQIVVRRIAERLGFVSDVAHSPADAFAQLGRQIYAVVFVDWELPGMKGDEFTRRLRELPAGRDAIVIATTAHDSDEIRRACAAAGMDGFALKPFETETIARVLEEVRLRRGAPAGLPARLDTRVFRFVGYDDPAQAGQAAQLYLEILEREVAMLEGAMSQQDAAGAAAAAHRIKSHAGLVDAAELRESADRLQREARSAPAQALASLQLDLVRHASALRERLKSWRSEDGAG